MADGVIAGKTPDVRGVAQRLDWYRYKAQTMQFLGMRTFSKDLLEFGACQHWNPESHGGNDWVYYDSSTKDLWREIVGLMGKYGFEILPYYEYSGSKGADGLGNQRRCKPLTRDDAYTHIAWIENANADLTDPDTYRDFEQMLDCTVLEERAQARFAGIWIRPRSQLPISFADKTRARFAAEANGNTAVTRQQIADDQKLYHRYIEWWETKRRDFCVAMRDYLTNGGIANPQVLFTGCPSEPGVPFATWTPYLVTDRPDQWSPILSHAEHLTSSHGAIQAISVQETVRNNMYLQALLSPGLTWGGWEVQHANPADDPRHYKDTPGVLLTHAFNRLYTVASPQTFDTYRNTAAWQLSATMR